VNEEPKSANLNHSEYDHGDYERRDIGIAPVLYFLLALAIGGVFVYFIANGLYSFLERRYQAETPISPLVTNEPVDTRKLPAEYSGPDGYEKYLKQNFPAPQLETNERGQLDQVRINEENTLSTYGWVDQPAGTVRIPIDRAMDLIVQRGLPVRNALNLGVSIRPPDASTKPAAQAPPQKTKANTKK
jgi:hypothetical protein